MMAHKADSPTGDFERFFDAAEPRLRRALVARLGPDRGRAAAVEALAYGWQHWHRVGSLANPVGYLYRVGLRTGYVRWRDSELPSERTPAAFGPELPWVEPKLAVALNALTPSQRSAVVLRFGFEWTLKEIAEVQGIRVSSVRNHIRRGLRKLRAVMGVEQNA